MPSLPLESFWQSQGAVWMEERGWKIPASFGSPEAEKSALTQNAACTDQSHRGKIKVTGADRLSFLNRMLTNDLQAAILGGGQRTFLLSAQGKCLADFRALIAPDFIILDTEPALAPEAIQSLDKFIITDDIQLEDITLTVLHLSVDGPKADHYRAFFQSQWPQAVLFHLAESASLSGYPALHVILPLEQADKLIDSLNTHSIAFCAHTVFNQVRLERKVPRFKIDFDETWFLNETGLDETAASETKGCYPGQEVVAKIKTYKKMPKRLFI